MPSDRKERSDAPLGAAIRRCKAIESQLRDSFGGNGNSLVELTRSLQRNLPEDVARDLFWIGGIRNRLAHETGYDVPNEQDEFHDRCDRVECVLESMLAEPRSNKRNRLLAIAAVGITLLVVGALVLIATQ